MSRVLTIDVGAGTMDVLYADTESGMHYKAVVRSPVAAVAEQIRSAKKKLLLVGTEMGGGAVSQAVRQRAAKENVVTSTSAAMTLSHDPDRVRRLGLDVLSDERAEELAEDGGFSVVRLGDIEAARIKMIVKSFGVPFAFDAIGVCAQDHGMAPPGVSHLDYRHNHHKAILEAKPHLCSFLRRAEDVPEDMSRLRVIVGAAQKLTEAQVYVMDSGMAGMLGASMDPRVRASRRSIVLDVATSHTVAAALEGGELCAFFEYHTKDITTDHMDRLIEELAEGRLEHRQILAEGGHGAYTRRALGFDSVEVILVTGPKRRLLADSRLEMTLGSPLGDNMMTGTVGLLEAIRRHEGWPAIAYT